MNKFLFFITLLIVICLEEVKAIEAVCNFEEIYKNGQIQQGFILVNNENLRYEYYDPNLYKIIYKDSQLSLILNKNNTIQNLPAEHSVLIENIYKIFKQFPNIPNEVIIDSVVFKTELNQDSSFISRLAVVSNKINMSIYFYDCETRPINGIFFKSNPVFEYKFK